MRDQTHLELRGTVYWFRMRVPNDLREAVGNLRQQLDSLLEAHAGLEFETFASEDPRGRARLPGQARAEVHRQVGAGNLPVRRRLFRLIRRGAAVPTAQLPGG